MQLPQISIDLGHINSGEMNQDGSTITITNEKGYIYEYRREINSSSLTVPPVVDHCKWVYTAYVCDCSKIPNTNSLGQHIICPCRNGFKWVNSACIVNCEGNLAISATSDLLSCNCKTGYLWNSISGLCEPICTNHYAGKIL